MSALNVSHPHKVKHQVLNTPEPYAQQEQDNLLQSFPLPRYFQVHFQHIHERTDTVHKELTELKSHINTLETQLNTVLLLLQQHRCND